MKIMCLEFHCLNFKIMCEQCNRNQGKKFVDRQINTADFDRVMVIGQQTLVSGKSGEFIENKIIIKGGGGRHKVAQMLSSAFIQTPELVELFEMAKELIPIMKQKTM